MVRPSVRPSTWPRRLSSSRRSASGSYSGSFSCFFLFTFFDCCSLVFDPATHDVLTPATTPASFLAHFCCCYYSCSYSYFRADRESALFASYSARSFEEAMSFESENSAPVLTTEAIQVKIQILKIITLTGSTNTSAGGQEVFCRVGQKWKI